MALAKGIGYSLSVAVVGTKVCGRYISESIANIDPTVSFLEAGY